MPARGCDSVGSVETKREVVLVDDDPGFAETMSAILRYEGYGVVVQDTYATALAYLDTHRPDVLITDVSLGPRANGWQLAKHAMQRQPELQVIVVTARADHLEADIEYWRLPVFLKPFDPDDLLKHLRRSMEQKPA